MIVELTDDLGHPVTDEVVLRGHAIAEDDARAAVIEWLDCLYICDSDTYADTWWRGLAWTERRETYARKIPTNDGDGTWTLHRPCEKGSGAFAITVLPHTVDLLAAAKERARRDRIEAAVAAVWPDCEPSILSGYAGGYVRGVMHGMSATLSWQHGGPDQDPIAMIPQMHLGTDEVALFVADVRRVHELAKDDQ